METRIVFLEPDPLADHKTRDDLATLARVEMPLGECHRGAAARALHVTDVHRRCAIVGEAEAGFEHGVVGGGVEFERFCG